MLNIKLPSIITSENISASWASMFIIATSHFFPSKTLDTNPNFNTAPAPTTRTTIAFPCRYSRYWKSTIRTVSSYRLSGHILEARDSPLKEELVQIELELDLIEH